jgi:hypothetical protein
LIWRASCAGPRNPAAGHIPQPISIRFGIAAAHGDAISFDRLYTAADGALIDEKRRPPRRELAIATR